MPLGDEAKYFDLALRQETRACDARGRNVAIEHGASLRGVRRSPEAIQDAHGCLGLLAPTLRAVEAHEHPR
jgi:hypothetical protein